MTADPRTGNADPDEAVVVGELELADRVRAVLSDRSTVREVAMFGGLAFMVDDRMVVSVHRNGDGLLVRVDPDRDEQLLTQHGAQRAHMGSGRPMGTGWISVARDAIDTDAGLRSWMDVALDYNTNETAREPRSPS